MPPFHDPGVPAPLMGAPAPEPIQQKAPELVPVEAYADGSTRTAVAVSPTQVRRPWRSTARTLFQAFVALAVLFPVLVDQTGLSSADLPWLAIPLGVAAAVTRIMSLPQVETFLRRFLPFLAAAPAPVSEADEGGHGNACILISVAALALAVAAICGLRLG